MNENLKMMKKLFAVLTILSLVCAVSFAQANAVEKVAGDKIEKVVNGPVMTFAETVVDYGTIDQGSEPLRKFTFSNTGTEPLVIKHARGSCGCTVPTYPKEPIMPGEASVIEVRYDTKRVGPFEKTVTLTTNEEGEKRVLKIKGKVLKVAAEPEAVPASKQSLFSNGGGK